MSDCCNVSVSKTAAKFKELEPRLSSSRNHGIQFKIFGMDCAEEVTTIKREIAPLVQDTEQLGFDILNGKMTVFAPAETVSVEEIIKAIARTGMRAEFLAENSKAPLAKDTYWQRKGRTVLTIVSGILTLWGFFFHVWAAGSIASALGQGSHIADHVPIGARCLYGLAILSGSWFVLPKAWYALKKLRPDMNLLMTFAVLGAVLIGEWSEGATVAFLFALSLALESWSVGRARRAVQALMDLTPPKVLRFNDGGPEIEVSPEQITVGEKFIVRPGERISLDGRIFRGASEINQAPITGESAPVAKKQGDEVFAGTINGDASLVIESTKLASDTTLAHIIKMVSEAQSRRSPSDQWVERFAHIYTPVVMAVALLVALLPPLFFQADWSIWFYRSLVLLVIACPCALVISTPVSIVAALAAAARNGILVKGGMYLEIPARLKAIAFDKTGTLTTGKLSVAEVVPMSGHDEKELLALALALENGSTHPIAKAIVEYAREQAVEVKSAQDFQIIQGKGAKGFVDGEEYWLGSHKYLEERNEETPEVHRKLEDMSASGKTVVVIGNSRHVCGFIGLLDKVRPEVPQTIRDLRRIGIDRIVMLTGDNQGTANAITRDAGVDEAKAELLPADKVSAIENLVLEYKCVAMVGDGINDAPAMGRASVGIAMGAAGSDAAIETADIALMSDDLTKLSWLVEHARRTLTVIRQNIGFSLAVKAVFVGLSLTSYASLWAAIAADMGVSLLVVFNGLRLLKI